MFIIGIAGGSGSGKTSLAKNIGAQFDSQQVTIIAHDHYYKDQSHKAFENRLQANYDHPESLESDLLVQHLKSLSQGEAIQQPTYDFLEHTRSHVTVEISPRPVIVVEGILLFAEAALLELFDIKIFVDTPADIRFIRRLQRDVHERGRSAESVIDQYLSTVKPMHDAFVEPSKQHADVIIPEGGENSRALDMVLARVRELV